jgi:chromosome segregation protein
MYLKSLELVGFKSFGKKSVLDFSTPITAIVGPNGSGKSNTAEAFRFVLGEQSMKGLRSKRGEDLIWGGSSEVPRSNRASVKAVFDNSKRLLSVDFDEVVLERVVFRDGTNEYLINGTKVRLKDITTLLSNANIGSSGHHIISQGEADRVISSTPKERRQIIEDALGLRIYQYKKDESLKKLEKTKENKKQVEALRLENKPHLNFLERQVKKMEKARQLKDKLVVAYHEYLKNEEEYLKYESESIKGERKEPSRKLVEMEDRISEIRRTLEKTKTAERENKELIALKNRLDTLRDDASGYSRGIGRIEGQIAFEEKRIEEEKNKITKEEGAPVPYRDVKKFWTEIMNVFSRIEEGSDVKHLSSALEKIKKIVKNFSNEHNVKEVKYEPDFRMLNALTDEKEKLEEKLQKITAEIENVENEIKIIEDEMEKEKDDDHEMEKELFTLVAEQTKIRSVISQLELRERNLKNDEEEFKREISEGIALIGSAIRDYKNFEIENSNIDLDKGFVEERSVQIERRKKLEKMKIRLEEIGGSANEEIMKEYKETKERDDFLANELADLDKSIETLNKLIEDLDIELAEKFKKGLEAISSQFNDFFVLMFGGGSAKLKIMKEKIKAQKSDELAGFDMESDDSDLKSGVDIEVSLPKKRIQSLMMLSGGERALTSIALIFAMSQVNPPPFIILDETDAALDEANSRRYGEMIVNLSKKSQLIVITHNRETMSRADVLYGITMGMDGVSRILSVKFDDAVAVAK